MFVLNHFLCKKKQCKNGLEKLRTCRRTGDEKRERLTYRFITCDSYHLIYKNLKKNILTEPMQPSVDLMYIQLYHCWRILC